MVGAAESHELDDRPSPLGDDDFLTTLGHLEVATQLGLEAGDPDLGHVTIMVTWRRRRQSPRQSTRSLPTMGYTRRDELRQPRRVHDLRPPPRRQARARRLRDVRPDAGRALRPGAREE